MRKGGEPIEPPKDCRIASQVTSQYLIRSKLLCPLANGALSIATLLTLTTRYDQVHFMHTALLILPYGVAYLNWDSLSYIGRAHFRWNLPLAHIPWRPQVHNHKPPSASGRYRTSPHKVGWFWQGGQQVHAPDWQWTALGLGQFIFFSFHFFFFFWFVGFSALATFSWPSSSLVHLKLSQNT